MWGAREYLLRRTTGLHSKPCKANNPLSDVANLPYLDTMHLSNHRLRTFIMHNLAGEFADSTIYSFLVTLLLISLYLFIVALYNASLDHTLAEIPRSLADWTKLELRRKCFRTMPNVASQFLGFSAIDVLVASAAILVGLVLAGIWRGLPAFLDTREDVSATHNYGGIVQSIRDDKERLMRLEGQCQTQRKQLDKLTKLEPQLTKAYACLNDQKALIARTQRLNEEQRNHIRGLELNLASTKQKFAQMEANFTTTILQLQSQSIQQQTQLKSVSSKRDDFAKIIIDLQNANGQLKSLASTSLTNHSKTATSSAAPFVLVLVDGDAYNWSLEHFTPSIASPGAHAAESIKRKVEQYIPPQCQVVTRVFYNGQGTASLEVRTGRAAKGRLSEFARAFNESGPLFDYLDCGSGKERADSKIQGTLPISPIGCTLTILAATAHLFIGNPHCHTIFLAAASDNSFARLLEQYAYNEAAKKKIILIHTGYVAREIEKLGYPAVEWPNVFAHRVDPVAVTNAKRVANVKEQEKRQMARDATLAIFDGVFGLKRIGYMSLNTVCGLRTTVAGSYARTATPRDEGVIEELD